MNEMSISKPDEITMRLVHYFVTKENYQPIIVNGLDNEIWLENLDKDYSVIRINGNYIHNKEQLDFDKFKASTVIKQIKRMPHKCTCQLKVDRVKNHTKPISVLYWIGLLYCNL